MPARVRSKRSTSRPQTRADFAALATRLRPKDWTRAGFRARAANLAVALLSRGVPPAALDAWWPGGAENDDEGGVGPFARCWGHYWHLSTGTEARRAGSDTALQRAILDGITERPVEVACTDGVTRGVYAKSLPVHFALTAIDETLGDPALPATTWSVRVLQWVWIVTTPGPKAPFDVTQPTAAWPVPPDDGATAWLYALSELDLLALVQGYNAVDRDAIQVLCAAFPRTSGAPSRLGMAGFLGTVAKDTELSEQSARRVIASRVSEAIVHEEARAEAEQEAARTPPAGRRR